MIAEKIGARGLVCSAERLKIFLDVCDGLVRVGSIPLGSVFAVKIIVVIAFLGALKVHFINVPFINAIDH